MNRGNVGAHMIKADECSVLVCPSLTAFAPLAPKWNVHQDFLRNAPGNLRGPYFSAMKHREMVMVGKWFRSARLSKKSSEPTTPIT